MGSRAAWKLEAGAASGGRTGSWGEASWMTAHHREVPTRMAEPRPDNRSSWPRELPWPRSTWNRAAGNGGTGPRAREAGRGRMRLVLGGARMRGFRSLLRMGARMSGTTATRSWCAARAFSRAASCRSGERACLELGERLRAAVAQESHGHGREHLPQAQMSDSRPRLRRSRIPATAESARLEFRCAPSDLSCAGMACSRGTAAPAAAEARVRGSRPRLREARS